MILIDSVYPILDMHVLMIIGIYIDTGGVGMSKYYIVGGLLCISGLIIVGFQAISSMMNPGEMVWKSLSIAGIVDTEYLKWIDGISWYRIQKIMKYIVKMPLYILLLCVGGLSFVVGGLIDK